MKDMITSWWMRLKTSSHIIIWWEPEITNDDIINENYSLLDSNLFSNIIPLKIITLIWIKENKDRIKDDGIPLSWINFSNNHYTFSNSYHCWILFSEFLIFEYNIATVTLFSSYAFWKRWKWQWIVVKGNESLLHIEKEKGKHKLKMIRVS